MVLAPIAAPFRVLSRKYIMTGDNVLVEKISSHTHKGVLGVLFKVSIKHPNLFYMGVSPPGKVYC